MVELDKVHDGVILDGVGYQKDSREVRKLKNRKVNAGSTDQAQLIQFDNGDYYVASKEMENVRTDISSKDVRYREKRGLKGLFERISQGISAMADRNGGWIK